ncbi:LacI family DNA-binding transcriptional regulator [Demequina flava]|uniref:LacI family DNA-binding transcriptional regulator n=1 Tax=Demequina flava TaxID=1095025 RepID=UPI00078154F0|nr:LacI family DNA-binding transcriptional regulator [Demequina flava]
MVKIVDVARAAGVAPSTVSRALNGDPTVTQEYLDRVREAAEALGYRPNRVARSLRRQSTDVVALIIPDVGNNFCTAITRGVEDVAREAGLSVLLCNSDEDSAKEAMYLDIAEAQRVAGVVIAPHSQDADVSLVVDSGIPVVAIDRHLGDKVDSITTDSRTGAREATAHLLEAGWERPGCCGGPRDIETAWWRADGYRDAVEEAGVPATIAHGTYDREGGAAAAAELLDGHPELDSLFISNEQMALGVLAELGRRGLRPGVDMGVLTFDDTPWAPLMAPPMSVVEQPAYEIGARAARLLTDRIRGDVSGTPCHEVLPTRLVVRESSRRATR